MRLRSRLQWRSRSRSCVRRKGVRGSRRVRRTAECFRLNGATTNYFCPPYKLAGMSSSNRPNFDDIKDKRRQKQLIKNTIQLMTAATGVFVVRLSASDIKRIRSVAHDENDPLKMLLDKKI